jgi:hypothetical protein
VHDSGYDPPLSTRALHKVGRLAGGVWFRWARFFMVAPNSEAKHACLQAEIPLNALFKIPGHLTIASSQRLGGSLR